MTPTQSQLARLDRAIDTALRNGHTDLANMLRLERADMRLMTLEPAGTDRLLSVLRSAS